MQKRGEMRTEQKSALPNHLCATAFHIFLAEHQSVMPQMVKTHRIQGAQHGQAHHSQQNASHTAGKKSSATISCLRTGTRSRHWIHRIRGS